jgi:hypothetical protein
MAEVTQMEADGEFSEAQNLVQHFVRYPLLNYIILYFIDHVSNEKNEKLEEIRSEFETFFESLKEKAYASLLLWQWARNLPWPSALHVPASDIATKSCMGSVLRYAARADELATVEMLLNLGADPSIALSEAAFEGHETIVKLLLYTGADTNIRGGPNGTALQAAALRGHDVIVKLLLEAGADIDVRDGPYGTALQAAAFEGHETIVKLLLHAGANIDIQGGPYGTALQAAVSKGHDIIVKLLVEAGS